MFSFIDNNDIYHLLTGRTYMQLARALNTRFKEKNIPISHEQFSVMVILWEKDGCSQQVLAEKTFRDKPGVTRMLDNLERKELVYRQMDKKDRRSNLIFLTPKGKKIEKEVIETVKEVVKKASEGMSEADGMNLKRLLELVHSNLNS